MALTVLYVALTVLYVALTVLYVLTSLELAAVRDAEVFESLGDLLVEAARHRCLFQAGLDCLIRALTVLCVALTVLYMP